MVVGSQFLVIFFEQFTINSFEVIFSFMSVYFVADQWLAKMGLMGTNLMFPAGDQFCKDQ